MNIPEGYEPLRLNTMSGETVAHMICRRPDGGASDVRMTLKTPALSGICPACGRDMDGANGFYTCATGHLLIKMTTSEATARFTRSAPEVIAQTPPKRRITHRKASNAFPALRTHQRITHTDDDIRAAVEEAMKEMNQ